MFCKKCEKPCSPQFNYCYEHRQERVKAEFNCLYDSNDEKAAKSQLDQIFDKHHG